MEDFPKFSLADPDTWPPLLRLVAIVQNPKTGWPGILPMSRSAFMNAVKEGYIAPPVRLGGKVVAWRKEDILPIAGHGVQGRVAQRRAVKLAALEAHK